MDAKAAIAASAIKAAAPAAHKPADLMRLSEVSSMGFTHMGL